jgi:hypothetical protein
MPTNTARTLISSQPSHTAAAGARERAAPDGIIQTST